MINTLRNTLSQAKSRFQLSKLFQPTLQTTRHPKPRQTKEEPDFYKPGGYHRVSLGDTFNSGAYTVLRKLGYGQYSTVWLAQDSKRQGYAALKILRADCYNGPHDIFEQEILSKITDLSSRTKHEGRHHVLPLRDQFKHEGPNGEHVCFVFDVLGHHLDHQTVWFKHGRFPVRAVKTITRQLLFGLDFLHRECGIIHTGTIVYPFHMSHVLVLTEPDLKPSNILLELENPEQTITKYLSEVPIRTETTQSGTKIPLREVIKTPLVSEMREPRIRIVDFGVSSWTDRHLSNRIQPPALRAPEVTIGAPWGTAIDIWSLGCLVIEIVQGIILFNGEESENGTWTADDDRLAKIMEVLGKFPPEFLPKGRHTAKYFDEYGNLLRIPDLKPSSLEKLLNGTEMPFLKPDDMPTAEIPVFIDFLKCMLVIDPAYRKSAAELLHHQWLNL